MVIIMYSTSFSEETIDELYELGHRVFSLSQADINQLPAQVLDANQKI
jgi:hypothetical protein